ncbi:patatin-like phospholipase family protein [Catalinimonas niigatensis]|uniref:patatin-like phospholipase family protein n=1 Tax=Catalinimonas niigatensis TaxID=1397264 RepID=UPI002665B74E|nr:patatin-like phospholipase family protein [Catalinimonas niigatensis]WPP52721.1 patatin-like phospholipase family protein [Catalinimonas niigatensis]
MKNRNKIKEYFFDLKDISKRLWFVYFMIAIGGLALTLPSQARDLFQSFIFNFGKLNIYIFGFTSALFIWSVIIWSVSRSVLLLIPPPGHTYDQKKFFERNRFRNRPYLYWAKILPPLLSTMPYLITSLGFFYARLNGQEWETFLFIAIYLTLATLSYIIIHQLEKKRVKKCNLMRLQAFFYTHWLRKFKNLAPVYRRIYLMGVGFSALLLLLFMPGISREVSVFFGAPTIVIMGLTTATLALATLTYLDYRTRFPLLAITLFLSMFFSIFNNNHVIRTLPDTLIQQRPELTDYIEKWIREKSDNLAPRDSLPLIVVAAEGGGIRSLNWTAGVLKHLSDSLPEFYSHVLAISAVSGGSVGAAFYHTFQSDFSEAGEAQRDEEFLSLIEADYLSNVTAALMYPELVQVLLPFPVPFLDRARYLEEAWAHKYSTTTGSHSLDSAYLKFWQDNKLFTPRLFINSALTETGQKVIVSSVKLDSIFFPDVIDFHQETGKDVSMKVAVSVSARFPYVSPAATIRNREGKKSGNLVDGGYYENTGMGTAIQLLNAVTSVMDEMRKEGFSRPVKLMMIFIQNNDYSTNDPKNPNFLIDLIAPPKALLNTWGRQSVSVDETTKMLSKKLRYPIEYTKFELARKSERGEVILPLGWYISDTARQVFRRQIRNISRPFADSLGTDNYASYQTVKDFLPD